MKLHRQATPNSVWAEVQEARGRHSHQAKPNRCNDQQKKTRWSPGTGMPTRMLSNRDNTYVSDFPAKPLVGHPDLTHWRDTVIGHPCLTLLRNALVRHSWQSYLTLLWGTLRWHSCRTPLLDTIAKRSGKTLLFDTCVGHSCLTLV